MGGYEGVAIDERFDIHLLNRQGQGRLKEEAESVSRSILEPQEDVFMLG